MPDYRDDLEEPAALFVLRVISMVISVIALVIMVIFILTDGFGDFLYG